MKRKWVIISVFVIIGVIGIIGIASAMKGDVKVTEAEARNLIEAHYTGTIKKISLTKSNGKDVYHVRLEEKTGLYTLEVDAGTGNIQNLQQVKKEYPEREENLHSQKQKLKSLQRKSTAGTFRALL
ncbi:PepSY domain-containing protein [Bacillus sp. OVS6]|nr:PepSY domain-containing protein [Bacillus sp. OVS6]